MDKHRYHYYGVKGEESWHFSSNTRPNLIAWANQRLFVGSDLVWCQGSKGGVRLVFHNWALDSFRKYGYITQDEKAMQEFMWVKLKAKDIN